MSRLSALSICTVILIWTSPTSLGCKNILRTTCLSAFQVTNVLINDTTPLNKQLSIRCDYLSTPLIGWSHSPNGSETAELLDTSPSKYSVNGNILTINSISKSDEGLYRCIYELGQTKGLCLFVFGSAVFASCPLGCAGNPIPLSVESGESIRFKSTIIYTDGGSCGFKQEILRIALRKVQSGVVHSELLLSCAISQTTGCSRGRVFLTRQGDSLTFNFILSNALPGSDSGLYEVVAEGIHPATGSLTTITKRFQLEVTATDCGAPVPPQYGQLGPYNSTLEGSRVTFGCESGRFPIGEYAAICTSEGNWSPNPAQFVCSEPPPPTGILALCDVIVWETPDYYCDGILTGYQVQFYDAVADTQTMLIRDVPENKTFYVVQERDRLGGPHNTTIRVRAMTAMAGGIWSEEMTLACSPKNCSTCPPSSGSTIQCDSTYFSLGGRTYSNNSEVNMQEIGEAENALLCRTNNADCCKSSRTGEFYYSNGTAVPIRKVGHGFYRDRGEGEIRLNRLEKATLPMGKFRCEIPDANGDIQNLYITLV